MTGPSIAIVGAGPAGLAAAKALRDVGLTRITIFESTAHLGGIWSPKSRYCRPTMRTNISKYSCSFSDHPWPTSTKTFPFASEVGEYLESYAKTFGIFEAILFGCTVVDVKTVDQEKWNVTWTASPSAIEPSAKDVTKTAIFDYLIVASGFFTRPSPPNIAGLDKFPGTVIHSTEYRDPLLFKDKEVAIVGASFSAAEVANDLLPYVTRITNIVTRNYVMIPKYTPVDPTNPATPFLPMDLGAFRQIPRPMRHEILFPTQESNAARLERFRAILGEEAMVAFAGQGKEPIFLAVCDYNIEAIRSGKIKLQPGRLSSIDDNKLILSDGTSLDNIDTIILATGFEVSLKFLDPSILAQLSYDKTDGFVPILLDKSVLHPDFPTLAFIGMYRAPYFATMELEARSAASIFAGRTAMPSREAQLKGIDSERKIKAYRPRMQFPHADYVGLANDLYTEFGQLGSLDPLLSTQDPTVTASYYRPDNPISQAMQSQLVAELGASKDGKWVAAGVFRALYGKWKLARRVESKNPLYPSGIFHGSALFALTGEYEFAYKEDDQFNSGEEAALDQRNTRYIYRYSEENDRINVYFDEADSQNSNDQHLLYSMRFLNPLEKTSFPYPAEPKKGWRAIGEYQFEGDIYKAFYDFTFSGALIFEFGITFEVKGPKKDYVSAARYTR